MAKRQVARTVYDDAGRAVAATSDYAKRFNDLKLASAHIGASAPSQLRWAVSFVNEDPAQWHSAIASAHGDCLLALGGTYIAEFMYGGIKLPPSLSREEVAATHRAIKDMLYAAVQSAPPGTNGGESAGIVWLQSEGIEFGLVRASAVSAKPAIWATTYRSTSITTAVLHRVKDLVLSVGDRLVACKWCKHPFIAVKKQEFCDATCAQTARNDRKKPSGGRSGKATRKG